MILRIGPSVLALLMVAGVAPATAQEELSQGSPLTIYGIPFDAPFTISECNFSLVRDWTSPDRKATKPEYANTMWSESDGPCYAQAPINTGKPLLDGASVAILFPLKDRPRLGSVSVRIVEQKVAYIKIRTRGYDTQPLDYEMLVEKFGEPVSLERPTMQNRMGASFQAIHASWSLPRQASVHFFSVIDSLSDGQVVISTPAGQAAEKRAQEERRHSLSGSKL